MSADTATDEVSTDTEETYTLAWLLAKVEDTDVHRGPDLHYRVFVVGRNGHGVEERLCTVQIEALAEPTQRRGRFIPPLVRLLPNNLVELTTAGRETLDAERKRLGKANTRDRATLTSRRAATMPQFQAA